MKITAILIMVLAAGLHPVRAGSAQPGTVSGPAPVVPFEGVIQPGGVFTVLTLSAGEPVALSATRLREAGLAAGNTIRQSDEIRVFANRDKMNEAPLARIWFNLREGGDYWFHTGGSGRASDFVIPAGAAVVVWTRASAAPVEWESVFE